MMNCRIGWSVWDLVLKVLYHMLTICLKTVLRGFPFSIHHKDLYSAPLRQLLRSTLTTMAEKSSFELSIKGVRVGSLGEHAQRQWERV